MPPRTNPRAGTTRGTVATDKPQDMTVELRALQDVTVQLNQAKQLRNFYQLERDKVQKFWDISKKELANIKHELLNADEEIERMEANHEVEKKVYKQKVRHLNYEHRMMTQEIRAQSDREIEEITLKHQEQMQLLASQKQLLHTEVCTMKEKHEDKVKEARTEHDFLVQKTNRATYAAKIAETKAKYDEKISILRNELELRRRAELHEIEENINEHINEMTRKHDEAYREMKTYFNSITSNNLGLIRSLTEQIANMKQQDANNEKLMFEIEKENEDLNGPLEEVKRDVADLQQELHNYEKDKLSLRNTRSRLKSLHKEFGDLQQEYAALQEKYALVQRDRDVLVGKFETALQQTMDVVSMKNIDVEKQLVHAHMTMEDKDAQLSALMQAVNIELQAMESIAPHLEDELDSKNRAIKDLHYGLRKVESQHQRVVAEYERRCRKAGIPLLDLQTLSAA